MIRGNVLKPKILSPLGLLNRGHRFLESAITLGGSRSDAYAQFHPVPHYLIGHAIELLLKAYLSAEGTPERRLRKLNHDLDELLRSADDAGLGAHVSLSVTDRGSVEFLNTHYSTKQLEYTTLSAGETRLVSYQELPHLEEVASKLYDGLRGHCLAKTKEQREVERGIDSDTDSQE